MKKNTYFHFIIALYVPVLIFCTNPNSKTIQNNQIVTNRESTTKPTFSYDLTNPVKKIKLPDNLVEISALSFLKPGLLLAVQDEKADVFTIDYNNGKVSNHYVSDKNGDYEGIEAVGQNVYLLKSNGSITEHQNFAMEKHNIVHYNTLLTEKNDAEGLTYDATNNSLLIACKNRAWIKGHENKFANMRCIYSFDLSSKSLNTEPRLCIDLQLLKTNYGIENFMPSAIAIHPVDSNYYLLSAVGKLLLIINKTGSIVHVEKLDHAIFRQPEGICFSPDGEFLFISNEGRNKKGNILQFAKF